MSKIVAENLLEGSPSTEWDVVGIGSPGIQGFSTDNSVNVGETVSFKVSTAAADYRLDVYRMGYYGGLGARQVDETETDRGAAADPTGRRTGCDHRARGLRQRGMSPRNGRCRPTRRRESTSPRLVREDGIPGESNVVLRRARRRRCHRICCSRRRTRRGRPTTSTAISCLYDRPAGDAALRHEGELQPPVLDAFRRVRRQQDVQLRVPDGPLARSERL